MTTTEARTASSSPGTSRRRLLASGAGLLAGGGVLAGCSSGGGGAVETAAGGGSQAVALPLAGAGDLPVVEWEMTTSWPLAGAAFGTSEMNVGAVGFCDDVLQLTGGRFRITPHPADELAGALEVLDVVSSGTVACGHTIGYFYTGRNPTYGFSGGVPFGLTARQQYAWLYHYRDRESERTGLDVMREFYARDAGLIHFPCTSTGTQMGGFFNREVTSLADLSGLVMRIPGLGGEVMSRLGVTTQVLPAGEIAQALQTGVVDAAEYVGPYEDNALGIGSASRYYYYPGWWEPAASAEVMANLAAYQELPEPYQVALDLAAQLQYLKILGFLDAVQPYALEEIRAQGPETREFPADVIEAARTESEALLEETAEADADFATVLAHWRPYRDAVQQWHGLAERSMLDALSVRTPETPLLGDGVDGPVDEPGSTP